MARASPSCKSGDTSSTERGPGNHVTPFSGTRPAWVERLGLFQGNLAIILRPNVDHWPRCSLESERLRDEHGHLAARVVRQRAVVAVAAAAGDVLRGELLDPVGERRGARDVAVDPGAGRRRVAGPVLGLQAGRPPSGRGARESSGSSFRRRIRR